jgi:CO/xanthine dehydrogenase Mo-binding subunit
VATVEVFIRPDGKDKVTGLGRYTADLSLTGMLHARFVYAPTTHARLTRVDTARARALPGVLAVITHADVPDVLHGPFVPDRRLFAKDVVRFEGDVVAAVAALPRSSRSSSTSSRPAPTPSARSKTAPR